MNWKKPLRGKKGYRHVLVVPIRLQKVGSSLSGEDVPGDGGAFLKLQTVGGPLSGDGNAPSTCKASIKLQNVKGPLSGDGNVTVLVGHS